MNLYIKLKNYAKGKTLAMHMPGHKRMRGKLIARLPYHLDITEIDGFDNLHNASGILLHAQQSLQALYKSAHSFMLVNGSTAGILAGIRAATCQGDTVLVGRNCHKSVYNAIELCGLNPVYLVPPVLPEFGMHASITVSQVAKKLAEHPNIKLIIITSPTYEGVISDIAQISALAHASNIPILVDEAHGAHMFLANKSAVQCGADIVINSMHKTLPALTQTAVAHVNGALVSASQMATQLAVFQTSSPSYLLLASISDCAELLTKHGKQLHQKLQANLTQFYKQTSALKHIKVLNYLADNYLKELFDHDNTKLVISTLGSNCSGTQLMQRLRTEHNIELEMAYSHYAIAMTTLHDTKRSLMRLANALQKLDSTLHPETVLKQPTISHLPQKVCNANNLQGINGDVMALQSAIGHILLEAVWAYPPGVPLILPGEQFDNETFLTMQLLQQSGTALYSTSGNLPQKIKVTTEQNIIDKTPLTH